MTLLVHGHVHGTYSRSRIQNPGGLFFFKEKMTPGQGLLGSSRYETTVTTSTVRTQYVARLSGKQAKTIPST